jgi:cell division protein FtsL
MNRLAVIGLIVVAVLAVGVYRAKLGASETEGKNARVKTEIAAVTKEINVMRAEEAFLEQPSRIGPIARNRLGLEPSTPDQFTAPEQVGKRVGEARAALALPAPTVGQAVAPPVPPLKSAAQAAASPKPAVAVSPKPSPAAAAPAGQPAQ